MSQNTLSGRLSRLQSILNELKRFEKFLSPRPGTSARFQLKQSTTTTKTVEKAQIPGTKGKVFQYRIPLAVFDLLSLEIQFADSALGSGDKISTKTRRKFLS
jgi:hypothetical protein